MGAVTAAAWQMFDTDTESSTQMMLYQTPSSGARPAIKKEVGCDIISISSAYDASHWQRLAEAHQVSC